uniref:UV radiation resistance-associated gene protein n=1 Tax=Phallusia mammillata TaxID=59560 RepID=A0A6F9DVY5_9ASCI|nr:UV radiation resistance-associated gene protein [Phallusia mammillata]
MKQQDDDTGITFQASNQKICVLQQRRLRNVTTVAIRNLTIALQHHHDYANVPQNNEPLLYFSIHSSNPDQSSGNALGSIIYSSDKVRYSNNPTWSSFKLSAGNSSNVTEFTVRLWILQGSTSLPALQWSMSTSQLCYVGDRLYNDKVSFHSNTVVLRIDRWFYTNQNMVTIADDFEKSILSVADYADVRKSFSVSEFQKIISCQESIMQKRKSLEDTRKTIQKFQEKAKKHNDMKVELENLQHKINHLRQLLKREKSIQTIERRSADKKKLELKQQETDLAVKSDELKADRLKHREFYDNYIATREKIAQSGSQLGVRRKNILSELSQIFPISQVIKLKSENNSNFYSISGAILPDSEHLHNREDTQTSVALDFTAQLLSMMSLFLLVPLRYPIVHKGANLMILDHVTEKLSEKDRLFPLYVKGNKDRFLFEYGVFLLNKNVAQLRYYFGMGTSDLRMTLKNIHSLLVERLGAKSIFHSAPIPISVSEQDKLRTGSDSKSPSTSNGNLSSIPHILPTLNVPVTPQHQFNKIQTKDASPRKMAQRVEHRNSELSSLRGELFGTGNPPRNPTSVERGVDLFVGEPEQGHEEVTSDFRSDINKDSIDSIVPSTKPHRSHLTGLEEVGRPQTSKNETKSSKLKHATARAELLGRKSAGWSKRSNSSASSDSARSESRDERAASLGDDVTTEVVPRTRESLPYMSAIGSSGHMNGANFLLDGNDHVTVADQSQDEELDLC